MVDSLKLLIARQAEERIRECLANLSQWEPPLPAALPEELSTVTLELVSRFDTLAKDGLAAAAKGDAFVAMPMAVECERLTEELSTLLEAARTPEGIARWTAKRAAEREAAERRAEYERKQREEEAELERTRRREAIEREQARLEELRLTREERRKVVNFFRSQMRMRENDLPDSEQSDVIRHNDGHALVTARAGAGKTRALTYRAVYLAQARGVDPNDILLLAFNRKAAAEIEQRLTSLGVPVPHVMTFHALAKAMVGVQSDILTDDEDDQGFSRLRECLAGLVADLEQSEALFGLQLRQLMLALVEEEVEVPVGSVQTIDGEWVETSEHKLIWDFLFKHGFQPKTSRGVSATPGFEKAVLILVVKDRSIAFSIGSTGASDVNVREVGDLAHIQLKRGHAGEARDAMHARWRADLQRLGLAASQLSEEQLWQRVHASLRREFVRLTTTFVLRMRNQGLDAEQRQRLLDSHRPVSAGERMFLALAMQVYRRYEALIASNQILDFQELIVRAADRVRGGSTSWRRGQRSGDVRRLQHLMIDEFQDVSPLFMRLVDAMRSANPRIAVMGVGDDWQAINGFAGATTTYFQEFSHHFPGAAKLELRTNYRSAVRIVAAGNAVMAAHGSPAVAARTDQGSVYVADVAAFLPTAGEQQGSFRRLAAMRRVGQHHLNNGKSVALLSRTRKPAGLGNRWVDEFKRDLHPLADQLVIGTTVHQFKGKQSDVVFVVDAGSQAFPIIAKSWYLFRVFGDTKESLVEAERRLLYVAVTRAAEVVVLVTDNSLENGGLSELAGDAAAHLALLNWDQYPPPGPEARRVCRIEVVNMTPGWQDEGGTIPIKHLLKKQGYTYVTEPSARWARAAVLPEPGGIGELWPIVMQEPWVRDADRVLVSFSLEGREQVLVMISSGNWTCVKDSTQQSGSRTSLHEEAPGSQDRAADITIDTYVAGATYSNSDGRARQSLIAEHCRPGTPVTLQREPSNPYDSNAIAVIVGATQIGYVPRDIAAGLAAQLARGAEVRASITAVTGGGGYNWGANLRIHFAPLQECDLCGERYFSAEPWGWHEMGQCLK